MEQNGQALSIRAQKVLKIFQQFDVNTDGCLSRGEMASLVIAVNPRVKFSEEQITAILDEVFRTYGEYIDGPKGLSFQGLLRTYDDGAGDVDRDFDALGLHLDEPEGEGEGPGVREASSSAGRPAVASITDESAANVARKRPIVGAWAMSPNNGIAYEETWNLIEDLEILLRRLDVKIEDKRKQREEKRGGGLNGIDAAGDFDWSARDIGASSSDGTEKGEGLGGRRGEEELGSEYAPFKKSLNELRRKADGARSPENAFDGHIAMGRSLFEHRWHEEALISFRRAVELKPTDVRPHFLAGNTLYSLGKCTEARDAYVKALDAGEADMQQWSSLLPQVHVNLGIALEGEGMLLCASEHYREAAILNPAHYRALKLLGSALYGVGEYRAAEKALEEAVFLKPDYADAHCDLGSALHAVHDDEKAILEFQKAIDLKPDHLDALYNLGGLLKDSGRYERASEMYAKVLAIKPRQWQAQLNRAVSLLGAGDYDEATKAFKEAFKMTNRVELYDAITHLKQMQKRPKGLTTAIASAEESTTGRHSSVADAGTGFVVVENSRFRRATSKTTPREWLACGINIRNFQKHTRLSRCDIGTLRKVVEDSSNLPGVSKTGRGPPAPGDKLVRKAQLEKILRKLLGFLTPETFQGAVRAVNERVLAVLDRSGSGRVDIGMFLAVLAPVCGGSPDKRKRLVFDVLRLRGSAASEGVIPNSDAKHFIKYLRAIYLPSQGTSELAELHGEDDKAQISYPEFLEMFDEPNWGFGIMNTLVKLEMSDQVRHSGVMCAACDYPIIGPRFKEITASFNLCAICYSEGKVPSNVNQFDYNFKEYGSNADAMKDRFKFFSSWQEAAPAAIETV